MSPRWAVVRVAAEDGLRAQRAAVAALAPVTFAYDTAPPQAGRFGWGCEQCDFQTESEAAAFAHSDEAEHSLGQVPLGLFEPGGPELGDAQVDQRQRAQVLAQAGGRPVRRLGQGL